MPHEAAPVPELTSAAPPRQLPVWAMGLANLPTGFVYGFISTAMGILLAGRGVAVERIAAISFAAFAPTFSAWLLAPVLDVRFTKRTYGLAFAAIAALLLGAAVLALNHLTLFTVLLTASCTAVVLYSNAVAGWAPDALVAAEYDALSGWFNTANLGAAGVFSAGAVVALRLLPAVAAAGVLAAAVFAPALLLLRFPAPRKPEGRLRANFAAMRRDLVLVLRRARVWIGLVIFLSPASAFALTNLFSSLGRDFSAPERWVTALNGPGVAAACSAGCLAAIPLCRRWPRRAVYLAAGAGAGLCALAMAFAPRTLPVYAAGVLGYNLCQGFTYTAFVALELEIVGPGNALAGTMMAVLTASSNVPISTITLLDGHVHDALGLRAMFLADAACALLTVLLLWALVLPWMDRRAARRGESQPAREASA